MVYFLTWVLASLLATLASADFFTYPRPEGANSDYSEDPVWEVGQSQQILWYTSLPSVRLALNQQGVSSGGQEFLSINNTVSEFTWAGIPSQNLSLSNVFFFQIYDASQPIGTAGDLLATSHYVNITQPVSSSSTSSSSPSSTSISPKTAVISSASPITTKASTSAALSAAATSTALSSASSSGSSAASSGSTSSSSGSTNSVAIGVGVGLGVLVLILAAVAGFFYHRYRQKKRAVARMAPEASLYSGSQPQAYAPKQGVETWSDGQGYKHEMPAHPA